MIRHIVAWSFQDGFSAEENRRNAEKIKQDLERLKDIISGIADITVEIGLASSSNRDVMLNSLFETEADLANYQVHPEHEKAGTFIASVLKDRVCLDFYENI